MSAHHRGTDVLITLAVGGVLLAASQAESLRDALARLETRLTGSAHVFESATMHAAARTSEGVLRAVEAQTYDRRLELRAALNPVRLDERIVIVEIDDPSLARFGRWPWPRERQAALVAGLAAAGAKSILLDIEYPEASGEQDEALARAFALAPTQGMMYTRELPAPLELARRQLESRILEWLLGGTGGGNDGLPQDVLALATTPRLRQHADDVSRLGRHLMRRATADLMDAVREGTVPGLVPPPPPPGAEAMHPVLLLPAALGVVTENPTDPADALVQKLALAIGYSPEAIAKDQPVRAHLTAVVTLLASQRERLSELSLLMQRLRDQLLDRQVMAALDQDPNASPASAAEAASKRLNVPASVLEPRLVRLLDRRRSLRTIRDRDLVQVSGSPLPDLPPRGELNPPIPAVTRAYRHAGISVVDRDADGTLRRVPMAYRMNATYPGGKGTGDLPGQLTVGLQATLGPAARLLGLDLQRMTFLGDRAVIPGQSGGVAIPVDARGAALIDFRGRWGRDGFARINAVQVLEVRALKDTQESYLRSVPEYQALDVVQRAFKTPPPSLSPALGAHWAKRVPELAKEQAGLAREQLEKISLDMKAMVQALEDARHAKDAAGEAEVLADLERLRPLYDQLLVRLPVLEEKLRRAVAGKTCMVGVTSTGTTDISVIPLEERYINLGVHVNVLNQILAGSDLRQASFWTADLPILAVYLVLMPLILPALSIRGGALTTLLLLVSHMLLATWMLVYRGLWLAVGLPVIAVGSGYLLITLRRYLQDERQKQQIRAMFETYLDPKVVELMVADDTLWRELGGTEREITPFFSDLAGFSRASELLTPHELSDLLAEYLTPMTEVILKHGGIRERYVGDAIVAFFGAPVVFPDHAAKACLTVVEQFEIINQLREKWWVDQVPWYVKIRAAGLDLKFRIGVTTGPAKVGNFGSRTVKNYSMNGDVVNLASRLEGANKVYGTEVLCTEQTIREAAGVVEAREVDLIQVVGKQYPVHIYEILGRRGELKGERAQLAERFGQALVLYRARRFDDARKAFAALAQTYPDDGPTRTYIARLSDADYLDSLPSDWNGSYVADKK